MIPINLDRLNLSYELYKGGEKNITYISLNRDENLYDLSHEAC